MRSITWVRHGQSEWNAEGRWQGQTDIALSELGRRQARALGRRLTRLSPSFDQAFSSDLGRARETAELALQAWSEAPELSLDERLRELRFGCLEGKSKDDFTPEERKHAAEWWKSPYEIVLRGGGESMHQLRQRVDEWMNQLPERGAFLVFSHGGVIRDRLWRETGPPPKGAWSFSVENTSLTVIDYEPHRSLIQRVNDHAHLEGL